MLPLQKLKEIKPNTIFLKGTGLVIHPWFNNEPENLVDENGEPNKKGKYVKVKWVAIRGGIHDWAIYHSLDANLESSDYLGGFFHLISSYEDIAKYGAKLRKEEEIKKFIPCDEEAFGMYRQ